MYILRLRHRLNIVIHCFILSQPKHAWSSFQLKKDKGDWESMASGYPKMVDGFFVVRFPRFSHTIDYDPTVAGDEDGASGAVASAAYQDMAVGMSKVKILAKASEIQFQRMLGDASKLTDPVKIVMQKVVQIAKDGTEVAASICSSFPFGSSMLNPMNMFKKFADKMFNVVAKKAGQYIPNANNIKGSMIDFSANLGDDVGTLNISAVLAEQAGEVLIAGEKQPLKVGDMKFNMQLSKWKWCGTAGDVNAAAYLDLYMNVTSKMAATLKGSANDTAAPVAYDLGNNMTMSFSKKVRLFTLFHSSFNKCTFMFYVPVSILIYDCLERNQVFYYILLQTCHMIRITRIRYGFGQFFK